MSYNIWKQVRLAGAVICVVGAVMNSLPLNVMGLMAIFIGTVAGLDRVERILAEKEDDDDSAR